MGFMVSVADGAEVERDGESVGELAAIFREQRRHGHDLRPELQIEETSCNSSNPELSLTKLQWQVRFPTAYTHTL